MVQTIIKATGEGTTLTLGLAAATELEEELAELAEQQPVLNLFQTV